MTKKDIISTILNYEHLYHLEFRKAQHITGLGSKETHIAFEIRFLLLEITKELGLKAGETTTTKKDIISTLLNHERGCWAELRKAEIETGYTSELSELFRAKWLAIANLTQELGLKHSIR